MQTGSVLCVRPHAGAAWIPIPTRTMGTEHCVTLSSSKSPWAIRVLTRNKKGRESCDAILVLRAFEYDVRAQAFGVQPAPESGLQPEHKKQRLEDTETEEAGWRCR